jgi:hypothetical protein
MLIFYDYEVFEYDWLVVFYDLINKHKTVIVNNPELLKEFHEKNKNYIFVGFNSRHYDQYIHKGLLCDFDPYDITKFIIQDKRKGWEYSDLFNRVPMYNYDVYKGITDNGLKTLEAFMGNDIRETSVPFNIKRKLTITEINETIKYCTHDVMQLVEVFEERIDDFNTHLAMLNEFKLGLNHINKTSAQLIAVILGSQKREYNDEWDIFLPDTLRLNKYWYVGEWFKNNRSTDPYITNVAGVEHVFADGGLHGAIDNFYYECKPDELMIMADVASMYPSIMLVYDLLSRSIQDKARFKHIYDMNIELKKLKDPRRPIYKLICNTTYGCSGDQYNAMYDPRNRRLVCIFGQVLLLDLIEKLEPHIKLVQSNTDGILFICKRKDFDVIDDIVHEWETRTGLNMEFDYFKRIYQKDVNNYVAVTYEGKAKTKGAYVKKLSRLDNDLPIVNEALVNYMVHNTPIEKTIFNCTDLIKFQKVYKLTGNYEYVQHNGIKYYNKSYRVFASTNTDDTPIYKCKKDTKTKEECKFFDDGLCGCDKYGGICPFKNRSLCDWYSSVNTKGFKCDKFANTPEHAFILNTNINGTPIPPNLDKQWYVREAYKRLNQFKGGGNNGYY